MNIEKDHVRVVITSEMLHAAELASGLVHVNRTIASPIDTLTGILGEMVWAQYYFGDWHKHNLITNKGRSDFDSVEIKTSAFHFNRKLNLLVREDYSKKRKPKYYVQIIISIESGQSRILPDTNAYICGFALQQEVENAPYRQETKKGGGTAGYRTKFIPIVQLHPIQELPKDLKQF